MSFLLDVHVQVACKCPFVRQVMCHVMYSRTLAYEFESERQVERKVGRSHMVRDNLKGHQRGKYIGEKICLSFDMLK